MDATTTDGDSIIGDECHIVAKNPGGPRADPAMPEENIDHYANLILLCKVHHKLVDDQPNTFTTEKLIALKSNHEHWVRDMLQSRTDHGEHLHIAPRISTGKGVLSIVIGADAYDFDHDELANEEELDLVSWFLQHLHDWGDLGFTAESSDRVRAGFEISQHIRNLEQMGFGVFGTLETRRLRVQDKAVQISVAVVRVIRLSESTVGFAADAEEEVGGDMHQA